MTPASVLLAMYLILVAAGHFGMAVPAIFLGIIALLAGVAVLAGPWLPGVKS